MIKDIDDLEVGCVLEYDNDVYEVVDINGDTITDKKIHGTNGVGSIMDYDFNRWEVWIEQGYKIFSPGEWRKPDRAFDEHRERLINS